MSFQSSPIRRMTVEDIPWLAQLVRESWGDLVDLERCEKYYRATLDRRDHAYFRGELSAGGSILYLPYWSPANGQPMASDLFFCAKPKRAAIFELVLVMKRMIQWAKESGCRQHSFGALNGSDISSIAKRSGAADAVPVFRAVF